MGFVISKRKLLHAIKEMEMTAKRKKRKAGKKTRVRRENISRLRSLAYATDSSGSKISRRTTQHKRVIRKNKPLFKVMRGSVCSAQFTNKQDAIAYAKYLHRLYHCAVSVTK